MDAMRKHTDQYEVFVLFKNAPPGGCFSVSSDVQSGAETAVLYWIVLPWVSQRIQIMMAFDNTILQLKTPFKHNLANKWAYTMFDLWDTS